MSERPSIRCAPNGPLLVQRLEKLAGARDGREYETREKLALCRCGQSKTKPFCDGTHVAAGFTDEKQPDRTEDRRTHHEGQRITIHDNRGICAHAGFCTDGLPAVFKYGEEPWIDPDGAPVEEIERTVRACPSGALSFSIDGIEHRNPPAEADPRILVAPGGPYVVKGGVELQDVEWGEGASREHFDLCRCGQSKNKPFCDGTHWNVTFDEDA